MKTVRYGLLPIIVSAWQIAQLTDLQITGGAILNREIAKVGDYVVTDEHGFVFIADKTAFESKFGPIMEGDVP